MRNVKTTYHINKHPDFVYQKLEDFRSYSKFSEAVREVNVEYSSNDECVSDWEVSFRDGILKWSERDVFNASKRTIQFNQLSGDLERFDGVWRMNGDSTTELVFEATLDLGIPHLAELLEPIAEQALLENIDSIVKGFFSTDILTASDVCEKEHDLTAALA
ncbi:type II toxin-antitoxin system RatA family toxin [Aliikangiella sp. IMCC44359]|uniref:type II toxin-antitoxin system RatA family toxin n=1 Tax=Aliikangiella sp. IMCC44359 TaxID=3459125 RepID=UPI00403B0E63